MNSPRNPAKFHRISRENASKIQEARRISPRLVIILSQLAQQCSGESPNQFPMQTGLARASQTKIAKIPRNSANFDRISRENAPKRRVFRTWGPPEWSVCHQRPRNPPGVGYSSSLMELGASREVFAAFGGFSLISALGTDSLAGPESKMPRKS